MSSSRTLYAILGVAATATTEEIDDAHAHRRRALQDNPDELSLLTVAYDTLRHPQQRASYDRELASRQGNIPVLHAVERPSRRVGARPRTRIMLVLAAGVAAALLWFARPEPKPAARSASQQTTQASAVPETELSAPAAAGPSAPSPDVEAPATPSGEPAAAPDDSVTAAPPETAESVAPAATDSGPTRGTKRPGFDPQYLAWSLFAIHQKNHKQGSGVLIGTDRILTNCHVLAGGAINDIVVTHSVTTKRAKVEKYARLEDEDACLLFAPGAGGDSIEWGSAAELRPGDTVHTFGHPGGSTDIIWSEGRFLGQRVEGGGETVLWSDNYCRPGSSGGPLLDKDGRLVGIVRGGYVRAEAGQPSQFGPCVSVTEATAKALLGKPLFPIALAPAQYLRKR